MSYIQVKVDDTLKSEVDEVFRSFGLSTTAAIRMFLKRAAVMKTIPLSFEPIQSMSLKEELRLIKLAADMDASRNCAVHDLIEES